MRPEDLLHHDVQCLIDLVLWRHGNGLFELLELFKALELHWLHREDGSRDVGLQVLLGYLWLDRTIEERVEELEFVFFASFAHDWNKINEFGVVDWAVELTAVFDHKENFIGKIGVLDLQ